MGFKKARQQAGLTARQAANCLGVSIQNVYNWEANSYYPETERLKEIAKLYGCTVDELLKEKE